MVPGILYQAYPAFAFLIIMKLPDSWCQSWIITQIGSRNTMTFRGGPGGAQRVSDLLCFAGSLAAARSAKKEGLCL